MLQYTLKKHANGLDWLLKISILLFTYGYIYMHMHDSAYSPGNITLPLHHANWLTGIAVLILMPLNWSVEALKWKGLISALHPVSFAFALRAVLSGLPYALFTPQRLGEIPGRALQLPYNKRIHGGALTTFGSFAQNMATLVFGLAGIALLLPLMHTFSAGMYVFFLGITILVMLILAAIMLYFQPLAHTLGRLQWLPASWRKRLHLLQMPAQARRQALFLSMLRYSIFMLQYALLLQFFGISIPLPHALLAVAAIYLTMSIIPSFVLSDLGIRGSVAIFFLQHFTDSLGGVVAAASTLWLINLIFPALAGSWFVWQSKIIGR